MKDLKTTLLLILGFVIFSCGSKLESKDFSPSENQKSYAAYDEILEKSSPTIQSKVAIDKENTKISEASTTVKRKLIKTGKIEFEVENLKTITTNIKNAVKLFNGYIASENEQKEYDRISQTITIRVPSANFDKLLADIVKGIDHFDNKNIRVKDVTEEFVDVQARIKTKKELEAGYLELLKKAHSVGDILEIEREIGTLRADIESFEGRLKYLKNQVSYSTLEIKFYENKEIVNKDRFGSKFKNGFKNGWKALVYFFVGLINIWPFILIITALVYFIRRKIRNRKKKNKEI